MKKWNEIFMDKLKKTGAIVLICLMTLQLAAVTVSTMRSDRPLAEPETESVGAATAESRNDPPDPAQIPAQTSPVMSDEPSEPQDIPQIAPPTVTTEPSVTTDDAADTTDEIHIGGYEGGHTIDEDDPTADPTEPIPSPTEESDPAAPETEPQDSTPAEAPPAAPATSEGQGGLYDIADPDPDYGYKVVKVTGEDRELLEALIMGEAGNQGFIGVALVAQCIKDAMVYRGYETVAEVRAKLKYSGSITKTPNEDVKKAVAYIFDEGGYAVKHPIMYFYSCKNGIKNGFHETQEFVVQYKYHRFFWRIK